MPSEISMTPGATGGPGWVVHFPPPFRDPYLIRLCGELGARGAWRDSGARLTFRWLWAHRARVRVLHFHWPSTYYEALRSGPIRSPLVRAACLGLLLAKLATARALGYRLVWTAHDVVPHGSHPVLYALERSLGCRLFWHGVIAHCPAVAGEVRRRFRFTGPIRILPHGNFLDYYPDTTDRAAARMRLGVDERTFLYLHFGVIRPYKGLEALLRAFRSLPADAGLFIAGGGERGYVDALMAAARDDPRIRWDPRRVPDEEVQDYMHAADAVVLPYRRITTSGNLVLAMGFGKRVVVPAVGCVPDMADPAFAVTYDPAGGDAALAAALRAVRKLDPERAAAVGRERAAGWRWDRIAEETLSFYGSL